MNTIMNFRFHTRLRMYYSAEQLSAFQEILFSMELLNGVGPPTEFPPDYQLFFLVFFTLST
jgi:hypothetical protein